jgi:hypothetical protein
LQDYINESLDSIVWNYNLELYFRQKIDGVLAASVNFGMTLLATKSLYFADRHSFDPNLGQGFFDVLHLEGLDDRLNFLHVRLKVS